VLSNDRVGRLVFDRFDTRDHVVGRWEIVNVNTGDAIVSVVPGTDPTVTFADDGTLQVETGCNTGAGTWELRGDELTFGPLALTRRACIAPDGIDEQETAITQALQGTRLVQAAPDQLTLLHPRGTIALVTSR
jgi:heat shock protein HslJ